MLRANVQVGWSEGMKT
jgi:hypothetical protein